MTFSMKISDLEDGEDDPGEEVDLYFLRNGYAFICVYGYAFIRVYGSRFFFFFFSGLNLD